MTRPLLLLLPLLLTGCPTDIEGNSPGECDDGADNDEDGYFDCNDSDCYGAPVCNDEGDDDDAAGDDDDAAGDDDDSTSGDDDDATADDDDATGDDDDDAADDPPYIDDITYVYSSATTTFTFSIEAWDPDGSFGIPTLLWNVDGEAQPAVTVGDTPLGEFAFFDVELSGAVNGESYQVLFAIREQDGDTSAGYAVTAVATE